MNSLITDLGVFLKLKPVLCSQRCKSTNGHRQYQYKLQRRRRDSRSNVHQRYHWQKVLHNFDIRQSKDLDSARNKSPKRHHTHIFHEGSFQNSSSVIVKPPKLSDCKLEGSLYWWPPNTKNVLKSLTMQKLYRPLTLPEVVSETEMYFENIWRPMH